MADINNSLFRILDKLKVSFGLSSILPGSKLYQIAESIAYESTVSEEMINGYIRKNSLLTAQDTTLDDIGENFFGIKRLKTVKPTITESMKCLKFYTNNGVVFGEINKTPSGVLSDIVIPEGTLISGSVNNKSYTFRTVGQTTLSKTANVTYVNAVMSIGDFATIPANALKTHSFIGYTGAASKLLLVTNTTSIGTGRDKETDDNYRYRLTNSLKANSSSSYFGIKNQLLTIPGVSNIEIVNGAYGGGTFAVYVQGVTPITSDSLVTTIRDELSAIVPAWCTYTVNKPRYIGITITFKVNTGSVPISDYGIQSISNSVSDYVNNFYGNEFKLLQLQQVASYASSETFSTIIDSVQIYSGSGELRMYEEMTLGSDPTLYITNLDKLIIEPNIVSPIRIIQGV